MTNFASALFVISAANPAGTLLESWTPQVANGDLGTWSKQVFYPSGSAITDSTGRVRNNATNVGSVYTNNIVPAAADYTATIAFDLVTAADIAGVSVRCSVTAGNGAHYLLAMASPTQIILYRYSAAGTPTSLRTYAINWSALGSHALALAAQTSGSDVLLTATIDGAAQTPYTDTAPGSDFLAVGRAGYQFFSASAPGASTGMHITAFTAALAASSLAASPAQLPNNTAGNTVTLVGGNLGTPWTVGSPGAPTFGTSWAPSGAGTAPSVTAQTVTSTTQAQLTITTGTAPGILTVSDPANGTTTTITVVLPASTITVNNPLWWFSDSWYKNGGVYAQSGHMGAEAKCAFTGSAIAVLLLDQSRAPVGSSITLKWRLGDDGAWQTTAIGPSTTQVTLPTGALDPAKTYSLDVYIASVNVNNNRWLDPATNTFEAVRITGLQLDNGATLVDPGLLTGRMLAKGNSLTEGFNNTAPQDGYYTWARTLARAMNCELAQVGWCSSALTHAGTGNVPALFTIGSDVNSSWNKFYAGQSRLVSGKYPTIYDWLVTSHGRNEDFYATADATITAALAAYLTAERAAVDSTTKIAFVLDAAESTTAGSSKRAALLAGFTSYQGSVAATVLANGVTLYRGATDPLTFFVDLGNRMSTGLRAGLSGEVAFGTPSYRAADGCHYNVATQEEIGALITTALQASSTAAAAAGVLHGSGQVRRGR